MAISDMVEAVLSVVKLLLVIIVFLHAFTCAGEFCKNNGTLRMEGNETKCQCTHPFTGHYCEDYTCVNGLSTGLQYDPHSLFFNKLCVCDPGWTGVFCTTSLFNRCGEHGTEVNGKCQCNTNFVGDRCEFVTRCIHGQLYNGRCACHSGWEGDYCNHIICHQGQADQFSKQCICPAKYRGKHCNFCAGPSSSPPPECTAINGRRMIPVIGHKITIIDIWAIVIACGAGRYIVLSSP